MTRGFVKLPRSFFACPLWTTPARRTHVEAYFDLLQRQAFHNTSVPLPTGHVDLRAGQLFISCRKLATEWGWQGRQVRDFLEHLQDLKIATLEDMQTGFRITLYDPVADPSKNIFVNSPSSEDSSEESPDISPKKEEERKKSKNYDLANLPDSPTMREYKALHAEFPGVLESVEFIDYKENIRNQQRRQIEYGPKKLRELILEFQAQKTEKGGGGESATEESQNSVREILQESVENATLVEDD
ncbi:MAG: hypothetical protein KDB65_13150 [Calditrichaeota bacterium]|nr:hypothetical protein [Calditrichota bacterium]